MGHANSQLYGLGDAEARGPITRSRFSSDPSGEPDIGSREVPLTLVVSEPECTMGMRSGRSGIPQCAMHSMGEQVSAIHLVRTKVVQQHSQLRVTKTWSDGDQWASTC